MSKSSSKSLPSPLTTIVSGGQTGVDRAALDAAVECRLPIAGWCPKGRRSEQGPIPPQYDLKETAARSYSVRTEWNVRDSDGTLVIVMDKVTSGTKLTVGLARKAAKPLQIVKLRPDESGSLFRDENSLTEQIDSVVDWIYQHRIRVLNVAGPRGSSHKDVYADAMDFMVKVLQHTELQR